MQTRKSPPGSGQFTNTQTTNSISHLMASVNILSVWQRLGGEKLRSGRARAFWRQGDGKNVAIDGTRGLWRDFATGEGGGILALTQTVLSLSRSEAWAWLESEGFVPIRGRISRAELVDLKRIREQERKAVQMAEYWKRAKLMMLQGEKAIAGDSDNMDQLEQVAQAIFLLDRLLPSELLQAYSSSLEGDPDGTRFLVNQALADDRSCESLVWSVVDLLTRLQQEGNLNAA